MTSRPDVYKCGNLASAYQVGWTLVLYLALWAIALFCADGMFAVSVTLAGAPTDFLLFVYSTSSTTARTIHTAPGDAANDYVGSWFGRAYLRPAFLLDAKPSAPPRHIGRSRSPRLWRHLRVHGERVPKAVDAAASLVCAVPKPAGLSADRSGVSFHVENARAFYRQTEPRTG